MPVLFIVSVLLAASDAVFAVMAARSLSHANVVERLKNWFRQRLSGKKHLYPRRRPEQVRGRPL